MWWPWSWTLALSCWLLLVQCTSSDPKMNFTARIAVTTLDNQAHLEVANRTCALIDSETGSIKPHKILIFLDSSFFSMFRNWMVYYTGTCGNTTTPLHHLELICMDEKVQDLLDTVHLNCSAEYSSIIYGHQQKVKSRASMVWMKRLEIINAILSTGTDLILSDSDAFWVGNPYPDLNRFAEHSHIVASRGWFPFSLSRSWGSTLCMGFVYVKASAFTLYFFDQVLRNMMQKQLELEAYHHYLQTRETAYVSSSGNDSLLFDPSKWQADDNKTPDDQYSANKVLELMNITWPACMSLESRSHHHVGQLAFQGQPVYVTLLAESLYVRNCLDNPIEAIDKLKFPTRSLKNTVHSRTVNATVVHCLIAPGDSTRKQMYLAYYQLWKLPYKQHGAVRKALPKDILSLRAPKPTQLF